MKALILAAGFGKRLGNLTSTKPKCLVDVQGIPMLEYWILKLGNLGVKTFYINTHYLSHKVEKFVESKKFPYEINFLPEKKLLGTAGTVKENSHLFDDQTFIVHCDNICDDNLNGLIATYKNRPPNCTATMLTFSPNDITGCGMLDTDQNGVMTRYEEKPKVSELNKANGAVFIASREFFAELAKTSHETVDLCKDVIPKFCGKINCYHTVHDFIDIGTAENLFRAEIRR